MREVICDAVKTGACNGTTMNGNKCCHATRHKHGGACDGRCARGEESLNLKSYKCAPVDEMKNTKTMSEIYRAETGKDAMYRIYRKEFCDYHTLNYVRWLEKKAEGHPTEPTDITEGHRLFIAELKRQRADLRRRLERARAAFYSLAVMANEMASGEEI